MKALLVTSADEHFIDQAKQLFASAYFNAGWTGDYMLLSHRIPAPKLEWFRESSILVRECEPLSEGRVCGFHPVVLDRLYLFTPEFKAWDLVIYLDADIIVRASLESLTKTRGFAAVRESYHPLLSYSITPFDNPLLYERLKKQCDLDRARFNGGVLVFSTDIITGNTFACLKQLWHTYEDICRFGDQDILNIFFNKKWKELPLVYNARPEYFLDAYHIKPDKMKAVILHFPREMHKPWIETSYFYAEWKHNLEKAELIDLKNVPQPKIIYSLIEIRLYQLWLQILYILKKPGTPLWHLLVFKGKAMKLIRKRFNRPDNKS